MFLCMHKTDFALTLTSRLNIQLRQETAIHCMHFCFFQQLNTRSARNKEENVHNDLRCSFSILISLKAKIFSVFFFFFCKDNAICLMVWSNAIKPLAQLDIVYTLVEIISRKRWKNKTAHKIALYYYYCNSCHC